MLGVRIPPEAHKPDLEVDMDGNVAPGNGGMSVSPNLEALLRLLPTFIPRRLKRLADSPEIPPRLRVLLGRAAGSNSLHVWKSGEGPFVDGNLAPGLVLRVDHPTHGLVEPASEMPLPAYQECLYATRPSWRSAEPESEGNHG